MVCAPDPHHLIEIKILLHLTPLFKATVCGKRYGFQRMGMLQFSVSLEAHRSIWCHKFIDNDKLFLKKSDSVCSVSKSGSTCFLLHQYMILRMRYTGGMSLQGPCFRHNCFKTPLEPQPVILAQGS